MSEWAVPGYSELTKLGGGGFGAVVQATHDATGTRVAIKYLLPELRQDPDFVTMFRAEAEALGTLDDAYIVRLYEYVESPEGAAAGAAIVMELVEGVTLGAVIKEHGKASPEAALVMMYGSLLGLAAAHARGVVHRDYKPGNVLINANGASKLTDFGIATRAGTQAIGFSPPYAPPEQYDGSPASPAGDVYAATATFYECLTGHTPFTGTTTEIIEQHQSADVPMDPIPEPLQPLVARGMAKDPRYRPADAAAFATELRTIAIGAYGPDWEDRGRSQLASAAILLAALWPSAALPALHAASVEQVPLTHAAAQPAHAAQQAHTAQAAHHAPSKAALHRWHLRHVLHLDHLARNATIAVTAVAVVAAAATVAYTSRPPGSPGGTPAHPAVVAYQAPLTPPATISAPLLAGETPINGDIYMYYGTIPGLPSDFTADLSGEIKGATTGEVARLYAQQFPFTSPPAPVKSVTLKSVRGTAAYAFDMSPAIATRYQVKLLQNGAATIPLATSAIKTVYVVGYYYYPPSDGPNWSFSRCTQVCSQTVTITAYFPPSALPTEMAKQKYLYMGVKALTPSEVNVTSPTSLELDPTATASPPHQIADNAYQMTLSFSYPVNTTVLLAFCTKPNEAQDGMGFPSPSPCGSASIPASALYVWGEEVVG